MSRVSDDVMDVCEAEMLTHIDRLPSLDAVAEFERVQSGDGLVERETVRRYRELGLGPITSGVHTTRSGRAAETAARTTDKR